jgi:hypothetical protein
MLWKQFRAGSTFEVPSCGDRMFGQAIVQQSPTTIPSRAQTWAINTIKGCRNSEKVYSFRVARIDAPDELPSLRRGSLRSRIRPASADGGMRKHQLVISPPVQLHFSLFIALEDAAGCVRKKLGDSSECGRRTETASD